MIFWWFFFSFLFIRFATSDWPNVPFWLIELHRMFFDVWKNKTAIKTTHQWNETTMATTTTRRQQRWAQRKRLLSQQHKKRTKRSAKRQKLVHAFENEWIDLYFKQYWPVYNTNNEKNHMTTKHYWIRHITRGFSTFDEKNFKCRFKLQFKMTNFDFKHNTKNVYNCVSWKWIHLTTTLKHQIIRLDFYNLTHHRFWIMIIHLDLRIIKRIMIDFEIWSVIADLNERYKKRNYCSQSKNKRRFEQ